MANEAYETTTNQINADADVIFSNANEGSLGSIKAAVDANVYCFGVLGDYNAEAPDNCLMSLICDYGMTYVATVKAIAEGIDKTDVLWVGMADGAIRYVWNDNLKSEVPEDVIAAAEETAQKVISGEIHVPNEYE